jgi:hypothetical protein
MANKISLKPSEAEASGLGCQREDLGRRLSSGLAIYHSQNLEDFNMKYFMVIIWCFVHSSVTFGQDNSPTLFQPAEIIEDIDYLLESLYSIHPTFNQYLSDDSYKTKIDSIKTSIHQPLTKHQFFKIMQPLIAVDTHTSLRYDGKIYPEIEAPFFPFRIIIHNNQVYIKENLSANKEIKRGMIIESINGLPTPEIIDQLSRYIPRDVLKIRYYKISDEFYKFYQLVYGNFKEFSLVINDHGMRSELQVPGIKFENFRSESKPQFEFKMLENSITYLYIDIFRKPDFFMTYIDSVFRVLKQNKIEYLIIDKRSGGGFPSLVDSLLSYLTDKPYQQIEKKAVKISSANQDYINENKSNGIIKDGYLVIDYQPVFPVKRENMFKGKTFILMNKKTSSAASYFVAAIKCNHIAILVGKEAAQPLIGNGDITKFRLPNTELACYSSMSTYYLPCAENRNDSVKPDYEVKLTIEDLINDTDKYLDYVLEIINKDKMKI